MPYQSLSGHPDPTPRPPSRSRPRRSRSPSSPSRSIRRRQPSWPRSPVSQDRQASFLALSRVLYRGSAASAICFNAAAVVAMFSARARSRATGSPGLLGSLGASPCRAFIRALARSTRSCEIPRRSLYRRPQLLLIGGQLQPGMNRRDPRVGEGRPVLGIICICA